VLAHAFVPRGAAFKIFADVVKNVPTESFEMARPTAAALNYAVRKPKGVIGVISPWNAPPADDLEGRPGPGLRQHRGGQALRGNAGHRHPAGRGDERGGRAPGVYNVVHGFGPDSAGEFLTRHPGVDAITFTGETRTGAAIMKAGADGMRDVSFELGGKNAGIVFADADFDAAVDGIFRSAFRTPARSAWAPSASMSSGRSSTLRAGPEGRARR
jgi:aminomuconate-semialdehyde/2-hydroxymuconate-6-semialdehyde dehydrogenase